MDVSKVSYKFMNFNFCLLTFFKEKPNLPFYIKRSKYNNLPVYTDYKNAGSRKITIIRRIKGDLKVRFLNNIIIVQGKGSCGGARGAFP